MGIKNKLMEHLRLGRSTAAVAMDPPPQDRISPAPTSIHTLLDLIPVDQSLTDRWDQEWLHYFLNEDPRPFLVSHQHLNLIDQVQDKGPQEVYSTYLLSVDGTGGLSTLGALGIWVDGHHLVGKHILEVGCGPGFLGKQLGKIAAAYLGIDYSRLALSIARLTSPPNCLYYHLSDLAQIMTYTGTVDTMVGRNFFIHQNYHNLIWLMKLAFVLLKPNGVISADFYLSNPAVPQGIVHPARAELDPNYPSCAFEYTIPDIEQAARETEFVMDSLTDNLDLQRRFVLFKKQG